MIVFSYFDTRKKKTWTNYFTSAKIQRIYQNRFSFSSFFRRSARKDACFVLGIADVSIVLHSLTENVEVACIFPGLFSLCRNGDFVFAVFANI